MQYASNEEFAGVCEKAMSEAQTHQTLYDAILVDEAQDFPPAFLRLCYELLKSPKRLVYAYDELQNLSRDSMPPPEDIFGRFADGSPHVTFSEQSASRASQDVILSKCYRNSRPVLVTAHALGFGIYRKAVLKDHSGLVQMFNHPQLWQEIGYRVREGELRDGASVDLYRPEETSPSFLENHSPLDDIIQFHAFDSEEEQAEWIAQRIKQNLETDELRHDDIVVVNPDPLTTKSSVGPIRRRLIDFDVSSHTAGVDTDADIFFKNESESVTFTGIYRAKGNEAAMVYVINAQDCNASTWNLATIRNRLFTAITRSKVWVRVVGVGDGMRALVSEFERIKKNNFELKFRYPTAKEREQLKIVHRDVSAEESKRLKRRQQSIVDWVNEVRQGRAHLEDLEADVRQSLLDALIGK